MPKGSGKPKDAVHSSESFKNTTKVKSRRKKKSLKIMERRRTKEDVVSGESSGSDVGITIGSPRERSPTRKYAFQIEDPATYVNAPVTRRIARKWRDIYSNKDSGNIMLLIALYWLQGIPLGLAHGSIPFLLKEKLSFAQVGLFSLAGYPYSLKLFWSPLVDSVYNSKFGRRKSWIAPIQLITALIFWWMGSHIDSLVREPAEHIHEITYLFLAIVFLSATQDIAVDGWALTLLSEENLPLASTCQTVGINCGFFLSFTVFLALNSVEFSNKYIFSEPRDAGFLQLGPYMAFWALAYVVVTLYLIVFKREARPTEDESSFGIAKTYRTIWRICKLPHMQQFIAVLLVAKLGFIPNDSTTQLKLIERGLHREEMALAVLIDFPVQLIFGYYAATWSQGENKMKPWRVAFILRLLCSVLGMATVYYFPQDGLTSGYFYVVLLSKVASSMASTVQFVCISAFVAQIADPVIGGTYMTLLNTLSNFGGTWPVFFVMRAIDYFTSATCILPVGMGGSFPCSTQESRTHCLKEGGVCNLRWDGYYIVSSACVLLSMFLFVTYIHPTVLRLERLPTQVWRVTKESSR